MRKFGLLYLGPGAWLIGLNLLFSLAALVPVCLEGLVWLLAKGKINLGEMGILVGSLTLLALGAIGEIGYAVCIPLLVGACILLPVPKIPWRVKLVTVALEMTACWILYWTIGFIKMQFRHGILG
jgi:hypothetical protein